MKNMFNPYYYLFIRIGDLEHLGNTADRLTRLNPHDIIGWNVALHPSLAIKKLEYTWKNGVLKNLMRIGASNLVLIKKQKAFFNLIIFRI